MTQRIWLNEDWQFTKTYDERLHETDCTLPLDKIRIPHTVAQTPYHYFDESVYQMVSGYRRVLYAPETWRSKRVFLHFSAVGHSAWVYVNGTLAGEHHCGYTAFEVELGPCLRYDADNLIVVRVDSREDQDIPPFGNVIDYMTYGGIYREVALLITPPVRLADAWVRPKLPAGEFPSGEPKDWRMEGTVEVCLTLDGPGADAQAGEAFRDMTLVYEITDHETGRQAAAGETKLGIAGEASIQVPGARVWDVTAPNLYDLRLTLLESGLPLDSKTVRFGFRRSEFQADGYYLNGRKLKLRGLNRHQSYPYVGYAMPASMQRLDADILRRELGLNAVRTSHYPQSQHFVDRCDEVGLLVFTEIPGWQYLGGEAWKEQAKANVREMVLQYRNHPSVILWGVRINESADDDELYAATNAIAHDLDPDRPTGGVRYLEKSHLLEDVYTYNDFSHNGKTPGCKKKAAVTPDLSKPYLISEYNGHMYPTKAFDSEEHRLEHALRHANVLGEVNANQDIAGAFGWCMFDYNTHKDFGSGDRICYHGVLDMFRNPKLAAWVYASQQEDRPVLEVSSAMDIGEHPAGNLGSVYLFTNADSVRMYKNEELLKEYTPDPDGFGQLRHPPILIDDYVGSRMQAEEGFTDHQNKLVKSIMNYIARYGMDRLPARIKLQMAQAMALYHMSVTQAYDLYQKYVGNWGGKATTYRFEAVRNGQVVKTVIKSALERLTLQVDCDHTRLAEDSTYDVAAIRIRVCDESGNVQPFFNTPLPLAVEGPIELIGPARARIAGGMGGTYVKTTGVPGTASVRISLPEEYAGRGEETRTVLFQIEVPER